MEKSNQKKIVAIHRNKDGTFAKFKTNDNQILDYEIAKDLVSKGMISNAQTFKGRDGGTYIKGKSDGIKANNLSELDEF